MNENHIRQLNRLFHKALLHMRHSKKAGNNHAAALHLSHAMKIIDVIYESVRQEWENKANAGMQDELPFDL